MEEDKKQKWGEHGRGTEKGNVEDRARPAADGVRMNEHAQSVVIQPRKRGTGCVPEMEGSQIGLQEHLHADLRAPHGLIAGNGATSRAPRSTAARTHTVS